MRKIKVFTVMITGAANETIDTWYAALVGKEFECVLSFSPDDRTISYCVIRGTWYGPYPFVNGLISPLHCSVIREKIKSIDYLSIDKLPENTII